MAAKMVGVNPRVLQWARERAGYSLEEAAAKLNKSVETIEAWETGEQAPTYGQLETLAYTLYKRPIALFFFPEPPVEPEPNKSFRTLPASEIRSLAPDTRHAIRQAQAMQISLMELGLGKNPSERVIFRDIKIDLHDDVVIAASKVREYLDIPVHTQMTWKKTEDALTTWRDAVENSGIFVFKRSFKQDDVSGFCLLHEEFPVIYLNNSTTKSRQIFTLFHELAHLLLGTNGITKRDDSYISQLTGKDRDIEVFCNRFAAEVLVPSADFEKQLIRRTDPLELVSTLSKRYHVSREVILRKLLERRIIDQAYYEDHVARWREEYQDIRNQKDASGGSYYATQVVYLGNKYLELVFRRYYQGSVTLEQLAAYLNVKVRSVEGIEQRVLSKGIA